MFVKNVVCPGCRAVCDDIQFYSEDGVIEAKNICKIGDAKLKASASPQRLRKPLINKNGVLMPVAWDEALNRAADILVSSKRPLLFMGSEISCEAYEVGLMIGEYLGGIVDSNTIAGNGPVVMGIQEAGITGATAGQKKNRSDLVIYWGTNPLESMPRHMSRYGIFPRGYWTRKGRFDRNIITVDPRKTLTSMVSDTHLQLNINSDYELISALLTLLNGKTPHESVEEITGISVCDMKSLLSLMKNCNFGSILIGSGLSSSSGKHRNVEIMSVLVKELNNYSKITLGTLCGSCNDAGFKQVASYRYGYPFGLDFMRGYPRYNPGEFTAADLLREKDVDAVFVVCADLLNLLPVDCSAYLAEIPLVCLDIFPGITTMVSDIVLPSVMDSVECAGTFYRYDDLAVNCDSFMDSPFMFTESNEDTLNQLFVKIKERRGQCLCDTNYSVSGTENPESSLEPGNADRIML